MKKQLIFLFMLFLLIGFVSSEQQSLPAQKRGTCVNILQTCDNCTYVNLTTVNYPTQIYTLGKYMQKNGENYNYTFCNTNEIGTYIITTCGDVNGIKTCVDYDFEVTPNGFINNPTFSFLILILSLGFVVLGLWKEDVPITMMGDFGLYFFGIYTLFYGINGMKDSVTTWGLGIIVLGIAFYISVRAGMEYLNEL